MKVVSVFLFLLLLGCAQYLAAQVPAPSPQKEPEVTYKVILDELRYSSEQDTLASVNKELADAVRKRGIWFVLTDEYRKRLKAAGASDELLATIDTALPDSEKKRFEDIYRAYMVIVDYYPYTDTPRVKGAIDACKAFLTKYGDEPRVEDQVKWIRKVLPALEKRLIDLSEIR